MPIEFPANYWDRQNQKNDGYSTGPGLYILSHIDGGGSVSEPENLRMGACWIYLLGDGIRQGQTPHLQISEGGPFPEEAILRYRIGGERSIRPIK